MKSDGEAHRSIFDACSESAPSIKSCEYLLRRFKSGDFDVEKRMLRLIKKVRIWWIASVKIHNTEKLKTFSFDRKTFLLYVINFIVNKKSYYRKVKLS